jgi:hypothetical protein
MLVNVYVFLIVKFWILKLKSTYFSTWPNNRTVFSISFTVIMESFVNEL